MSASNKPDLDFNFIYLILNNIKLMSANIIYLFIKDKWVYLHVQKKKGGKNMNEIIVLSYCLSKFKCQKICYCS